MKAGVVEGGGGGEIPEDAITRSSTVESAGTREIGGGSTTRFP